MSQMPRLVRIQVSNYGHGSVVVNEWMEVVVDGESWHFRRPSSKSLLLFFSSKRGIDETAPSWWSGNSIVTGIGVELPRPHAGFMILERKSLTLSTSSPATGVSHDR